MKKVYLYGCLCLLLSFCGIAQNQNNNWTFGKNAGLTFNAALPNGFQFFTGSQMNAPKGCATISDRTTGQLQFYTDGRTVWNKNHVVMDNGNDLIGCPAAAQPAIIVPKPGTTKEYYIFTISGINLYQTGVPEKKGLAYSVVDMTLNGGLGGVTAVKNVSLFTNTDTEMLTSTLTNDGTGYWVVTQKDANFQAYKVTSMGINTTPVLSVALTSATGVSATRGLKISPNGQKLAARYLYNWGPEPGLTVYDFNNSTGTVSTSRHLTDYAWQYTEDVPANGVEFSPDGRYLYAGIRIACLCMGYSYIDQISVYDLNDPAPNLYWMSTIPLGTYALANLQLGKDDKIYCQIANATGSLSNNVMVISNPNMTGGNSYSTSNYTTPNPTKVGQGFPQLISLTTAPICEANLTISTPVTSSQDFQVSNTITATSAVSNNLTVNYKGLQVLLKPGFLASGNTTGKFRAFVAPCGGGVERPGDDFEEYAEATDVFEARETIATKSIKVSPNPNNGLFYVAFEKPSEGTVEISDMTGFTVFRSAFRDQDELQIDIQRMAKGIYIVKITADRQVHLEKIIKN